MSFTDFALNNKLHINFFFAQKKKKKKKTPKNDDFSTGKNSLMTKRQGV
jgi:hypothetical protein